VDADLTAIFLEVNDKGQLWRLCEVGMWIPNVGDLHGGALFARSRNCQFDENSCDKMFTPAMETAMRLKPLLNDGWTYRGEFLAKPKHNSMTYERVPVGNIIIFDIDRGDQDYLCYQDKLAEADRLGLECVPYIMELTGKFQSIEEMQDILKRQSVLGGTQGIEGFVIKNYQRYGKDKKCLMGKFVSEAFKELHTKEWGASNPNGKDIITVISGSLTTEARWNKAIQHLSENGLLSNEPKDIGLIIHEIQNDIEKECVDDIKDVLFKWAWKDISRKVVSGVPEWYKTKLAEQQFVEQGE